MIYILAPFSLNTNTTSKSRILSFYKKIKSCGLKVTIITPALLPEGGEAYIHGTSSDLVNLDVDFIALEPQKGMIHKLRSKAITSKTYKYIWDFLSLTYLIVTGVDLHYPTNELKTFFKQRKLKNTDILIASGPPFSLFKTVISLNRSAGCKLIMDYRDPWTYGYPPIDNNTFLAKLKQIVGRKIENQGLQMASAINCDNESVKKLFPEKYHHKINVILNGANLDSINSDFIADSSVFTIVYLGTTYYDQLKDETFFISLSNLIKMYIIKKGQLKVIFVGSSKNKTLPLVILKYKLEDFIYITDRMDIQDAMNICYTASVFLHLRYGTRQGVDTSKHLDYLALQKPILMPLTDDGNIASSIKANHAGYVCDNADECYLALEKLWQKHQQGESFIIPRNKEYLYSISREAEAEKLTTIIKNLL